LDGAVDHRRSDLDDDDDDDDYRDHDSLGFADCVDVDIGCDDVDDIRWC